MFCVYKLSLSYWCNQSHYSWSQWRVSVSFDSLHPEEKERWGLRLCAVPLNPKVVTEPCSNNESRSFAHRAGYDLIISATCCHTVSKIHFLLDKNLRISFPSAFISDGSDIGGKWKILHQGYVIYIQFCWKWGKELLPAEKTNCFHWLWFTIYNLLIWSYFSSEVRNCEDTWFIVDLPWKHKHIVLMSAVSFRESIL